MSILSRFFGRKDDSALIITHSAPLVANANFEDNLSLQVVFRELLDFQGEALNAALRTYHPSMKNALWEIEPDMGDFLALAGWGRHVIRMVGFNMPYAADAIEACVAPAAYPPEVKEQVRATVSNIILYYAGYDPSPLEQYVALAAVAGVLAQFGAVAVLNETAHSSLPIGVLSTDELGDKSLEILREGYPLTLLFCGFVKYQVEGVQGLWMRTYGADKFGVPDFAALAEGHHEGQKYSEIFNDILKYLIGSGAELAPGHTMQIGETTYLKFRTPLKGEDFLESSGELLVIELIEQDQINK